MEVKASNIVNSLKRTQREASAFRVLVEMFPKPLIAIDSRGVIQIANEACLKIFGVTRSNFIGNSLENFPKIKVKLEKTTIVRINDEDSGIRLGIVKKI